MLLAATAALMLTMVAKALPAAQLITMEPDLSHFGTTPKWAALRPSTADFGIHVGSRYFRNSIACNTNVII